MTLALQLIIIALGIFLLFVIIFATIEKKISESHALLWIVPCLLIIIGGIFPQLTYSLSDFFHTEYPPAIIFALAIIISYLILFQSFKSLSILAIKNSELASQTALLVERVRELEQTVQKLQACAESITDNRQNQWERNDNEDKERQKETQQEKEKEPDQEVKKEVITK